MNKKKDGQISDLLRPSLRFTRSTNLERDFHDSSALSGYVFTDFARECVDRLAEGLKPTSRQRAWRLTGDYGSGKSSFALYLAHRFGIPGLGDSRVSEEGSQFGKRANLAPVLVTCSRAPLGKSIVRGLSRTLAEFYPAKTAPKRVAKLQSRLQTGPESDEEVLEVIGEVKSLLGAEGRASGLLLIIDELGKSLEFAAFQPEQQDVYLLQQVAELAAASGESPLFVVCLLHQAFFAYADTLNAAAQREWEKVAGRFEEIVYNQPIEQVVRIVASALNVRTEDIPRSTKAELRGAMDAGIDLGWFGSASSEALREDAIGIYPLHPTVLPVAIRVFRRFGQNERSLFSFLLSNEPFGLRNFSEGRVEDAGLYRLHNLYDYIRTNFGHRIGAQSYRSHWNLIDSLVESFASADTTQIEVLKTLGVLNLLDDGDLLATEESLISALRNDAKSSCESVAAAIADLRKKKRALWDRGRSRGLCLWPHTSVDLEAAYDKARRAVPPTSRVAHLIADFLEARPIVARRHYIETGNLRHFGIRYCAVDQLETAIAENCDADGTILVPLCETDEEQTRALEFANREELRDRKELLVGVPQPLRQLANMVQEVQRWEWVTRNTPELNGDKYARDEVSRQSKFARLQLEQRLQSFVGLNRLSSEFSMRWFQAGEERTIRTGRELLEHLSDICDTSYNLAPRIQNELINRRSPSSAAIAARVRLIGLMFSNSADELLGLDPARKPPEMSMYLSVLKHSCLHRNDGKRWGFAVPVTEKGDPLRVGRALRRIHEILTDEPDSRVSVAHIFAELRKAPYGVRDGLLPIFLSAFVIENEKDVAFYKDGSFVREMNGDAMVVLTKAPERFELQFCKVHGVRAELFDQLTSVLAVARNQERPVELLDLVRTLCEFVAQLPPYVRNTKRLQPVAMSVRDAILAAREPGRLLFSDLPKACGFEAIQPKGGGQPSVAAFVKTLKGALDDLRAAFLLLQERIRTRFQEALNQPGMSFIEFRARTAERAERVMFGLTNAKLRAFCFRLSETNLGEPEWLESMGSLLGLKPPSKWLDADEDHFLSELAECAALFLRVESITFSQGGASKRTLGVRLAVTQANGAEHQEVLHYTADEEKRLIELERQFDALLRKEDRLALAAASKAIWRKLEQRCTKS